MSERMLIEEARKRMEIFGNIDKHLKAIAKIVKGIDKEAKVYLFGSVAEGRYVLSSDIDVLVVTDAYPGVIMAELWKRDIKDPFEIHVISRDLLGLYKRRAKLIEIKA